MIEKIHYRTMLAQSAVIRQFASADLQSERAFEAPRAVGRAPVNGLSDVR